MKPCACRFCLQVLVPEQVDIPAVHGTPDGSHGARERTDSNVPAQRGRLVRKFLLSPLSLVVDRRLRKPFAMRLQD
jgi:hypothetical protein